MQSVDLKVMIRAVNKASRGVMRDFMELESLQVSRKGVNDFVSNSDKKIEKLIVDYLLKHRPSYGVIAEEGTNKTADSEYSFVIDPIDGTTNFINGIPHWAICVGLLKGKEPVAGVILDPCKQELFYASKGDGAWFNDQRIRVSARNKLYETVIGVGSPVDDSIESFLEKNKRDIRKQYALMRKMGSSELNLAYVAAGRFDGYFDYNLSLWDWVAGSIIVKEAGGIFEEKKVQIKDKEYSLVTCANEDLFVALQKIIE